MTQESPKQCVHIHFLALCFLILIYFLEITISQTIRIVVVLVISQMKVKVPWLNLRYH